MEGLTMIEFFRRIRGMTLRELANQSGLALITVHSAEKGKVKSSQRTKQAIADALQVNPDILFESNFK